MEEKDYKQIPVYREIDDLDDLSELGRQDEKVIKFHENNSVNAAVIEWLNANRQNYFPDANHFHSDRMISDMADTFGLDRTMHVLLHNVADYDGRYTDDVKHRSRTEKYVMKPSLRREGYSRNADSAEFGYCHADMHSEYLNSLIKQGMELERMQLRENLPKFELGSKFKDEYGTELIVIGKRVGEPQKADWYNNDRLAARLGEMPDITLVVGMEKGMADGSTWIFSMKPFLQLNPDNSVSIGDYSHEMVTDYAFDPEKDDYIKDWEFSAKDFEIGFTYLNHNQCCYTVLDKGMTYLDEPFIKVQSVNDNPDHVWTAWAVRPEILEDGTLEWAYSKERDMTIDPEKNISLEEQEMNDTMKITANMTALMEGTEKDPSFRGFASITINDSYAVNNISVRENSNSNYPTAFYAELPSVKIGDNYEPVVYATAQAREALNVAISCAMKSALEQGKNMDNHYPTASADCAVGVNVKPLTVSIRDNPYDNCSVKAYAKVTIASHFEINRVKVCDGKNGNFVSMPSKKGDDGEYYDIVKPITAEARESLVNAVMARFEEQEKVIGNTPYSKIQDKVYASIKPENVSDIIPKLYEQNIGFSSLPRNEHITLMYSKADEGKVNSILAPYKEKAPTQSFGGKSQISDSVVKAVSADYAAQAANFLDSRNVQYSAKLAEDNTYLFTVNKADLWKLNAAVDVAKIGGVSNLPDRSNVRDFQAKAGQQMKEQMKEQIKNRTADERS